MLYTNFFLPKYRYSSRSLWNRAKFQKIRPCRQCRRSCHWWANVQKPSPAHRPSKRVVWIGLLDNWKKGVPECMLFGKYQNLTERCGCWNIMQLHGTSWSTQFWFMFFPWPSAFWPSALRWQLTKIHAFLRFCWYLFGYFWPRSSPVMWKQTPNPGRLSTRSSPPKVRWFCRQVCDDRGETPNFASHSCQLAPIQHHSPRRFLALHNICGSSHAEQCTAISFI